MTSSTSDFDYDANRKKWMKWARKRKWIQQQQQEQGDSNNKHD